MAGQDNSSIWTQLNIRNNAREMQEAMKDLYAWEKEIAGKEKAAVSKKRGGQQATPAVRGRAAPVQPSSDPAMLQPAAKLATGACYTQQTRGVCATLTPMICSYIVTYTWRLIRSC
jgi:hypothetical protein